MSTTNAWRERGAKQYKFNDNLHQIIHHRLKIDCLTNHIGVIEFVNNELETDYNDYYQQTTGRVSITKKLLDKLKKNKFITQEEIDDELSNTEKTDD